MSYEYKTRTTTITRSASDSPEKKSSKPEETTVGLQILVHLNFDPSFAKVKTESGATKDFQDPLAANVKQERVALV